MNTENNHMNHSKEAKSFVSSYFTVGQALYNKYAAFKTSLDNQF